jgi:uncharacterized membrane protein YfcA
MGHWVWHGVSSNTFLLVLGPASSRQCVCHGGGGYDGISGITHWRLGNVDKETFKKLIIPGVLGGIAGAYLLTAIDGNVIKPWISAYLLIMGFVILLKALRKANPEGREIKWIAPLGLVGGFMDAIGGGGWGPVVTTTLVAQGKHPRFSIGSVNSSEFFVTFAESVTFLLTLGGLLNNWPIIVGLLIGGGLAAPIAAYATKRLPTKVLMGLVGILTRPQSAHAYRRFLQDYVVDGERLLAARCCFQLLSTHWPHQPLLFSGLERNRARVSSLFEATQTDDHRMTGSLTARRGRSVNALALF